MKRCVCCFIPPGFFILDQQDIATDILSLWDFLFYPALFVLVIGPLFPAPQRVSCYREIPVGSSGLQSFRMGQ